MKFEVKGNFTSKSVRQNFTKTVEAKNESHAKHLIASLFGSKHKLLRRQVHIESVSQEKAGQEKK
jgi:ribosomal protein L20A (L18A)